MSNRSSLVARRLGRALLVLWGVSTAVFFILRLSGDPIALLLPGDAGPEQRAELRHTLGLDQPLPVQYVTFLSNLLQGDFGQSLRYGRPALDVVLDVLPATLELALLSMLLTLFIAIPLGVFGALKANTRAADLVMAFALIGQSTPAFVLGIVLIFVFSAQLHWLPTGGRGTFAQLLMPMTVVAMFFTASITRLTASALLDVMHQDYIRTARAKGLSERMVLVCHGLKNAALPVITVIGLQFGVVLSGAVVTETVFAWPGMGRLVIQSINTRDYPVVQAAVFLLASGFVLTNTVVDILYGVIDPRIRYT